MLSITKLQNLKAIHNFYLLFFAQYDDVINHKTTKFESNSQPFNIYRGERKGCYQSQNYKIWKQFITQTISKQYSNKLLSITKLQNLKAIHNTITALHNQSLVVINHKTTKFESNSQQDELMDLAAQSCYQSQNYKIWKQFTTPLLTARTVGVMLSITKLQNLKAIHNFFCIKEYLFPLFICFII